MRELAEKTGWILGRTGGLMALLAALAFSPWAAQAQDNAFAPALTVNGRVISNYEMQQRVFFFSLLQPNADATDEARKSLIDDRLRMGAAEALDIKVTPDNLQAGMEEFAGRVSLTAEAFLKAIGQRGVAPETFRDFVESGIMWREVVRKKFLPTINVTEREIDRAIAGGIASGGEEKVLLSEIALASEGPVDDMLLAERIKGDVKSEIGFAAAARLHSKAPSAKRGGQLDWVEMSKISPEIAGQIAALGTGEMTDPIVSSGSVMLFFLRDRSVAAGDGAKTPEVDFVRLVVSKGTDTDKIRAGLDRCEDLMPYARGLPEEGIQRQTMMEAALPADVAALVARLDAAESGVITSAGGQPTVVMLCSRQPASQIPPSRDDVRSQLLNQRMGQKAIIYLEALRTEALIIAP